MRSQKHSEDFKDAIVRKVLNRGNQTITEFCRKEGVALSTTTTWMRNRGSVAGMTKSRSATQWTADEKFRILIQSNGLNEEELGALFRREGLHSHQVSEWREDILKVLGSGPGKSRKVKDERDQRIRELEKDLCRKDKALAEASALLILQKKVNLIWGKESEGEK